MQGGMRTRHLHLMRPAAHRQGAFLQLHKELLRGPPQLTEATVIAAANAVDLDIDRLRADMHDPAIAAALKRNEALVRRLEIRTLPALIVGDQIYRGPNTPEALQNAVKQARKSGSPKQRQLRHR